MIRTRLTRSLLLTLTAVLATSAITAAHASSPTEASGTGSVTSCTFTNPQTVGTNTIVDLACVGIFTGTLSGTSVSQGTLMLNANGAARSDVVETFTGSVNGIAGTLTINNSAESNPASAVHGTDILVGGTGGLTNVRGVLHEVGNTVGLPIATYTGEIQLGQ
jgi:hypothetical protein